MTDPAFTATRGDAVLRTRNATAVPLADIPVLPPRLFHEEVVRRCTAGARLSALFPLAAAGGGVDLLAVLAEDGAGDLALVRGNLPPSGRYPSLTAALPQAQAFERELMEEVGLVPEGHPWPKPLRRHPELDGKGPAHEFFRVEGEGIHEVSVGPVHAGVIEPGHFRFQCRGEEVLHLEVQLGYQHRGAEARLLSAHPARRQTVAEALAGDSTIGHGLAHDTVLEALAGVDAPLAAQVIRGIALELERLANHVGDLGALCGDAGYQPAASYYGRLRGEFLNLLLELSGSRLGRGLLRPGGVRFGLSPEQRESILNRLAVVERDLEDTAAAAFTTASVLSRMERTGVLAAADADALGVVGLAARASGRGRDVRRDHPAGVYRFVHVPVTTAQDGDVLARATVRRIEIRRSITFVREQLGALPPGPLAAKLPAAPPAHLALALVEGWRGEILHAAATDAEGTVCDYKVVDPSFHNWMALTYAMRGNQISDFPITNKSFNLSYAGHDL